MWGSAITAYLHYSSFMLAFAALTVESMTFKAGLSVAQARKIAIADAVYGISATVVLITGVLRVLYFGKGTAYYLNNPFFLVKVGIFLVVGVLSLYPTVSFLLWLKSIQQNQPPKLEDVQVQRITWMIRCELLGLLVIPLFAALMARGITLNTWPGLF
jgi:putative membrane protein